MAQYRYERLQGEYARLWAGMRVTKVTAAIAQARHIIAAKARYKAVEQTTGVPWFVIGCLHMRESGGRFNCWLHNGDRMVAGGVPVRTVNVPARRPPDPAVSWEEGGYDALVTCQHLDELQSWCPERVAYAAELFNGFGYRHPARNIPSPYLWGGTSVQQRGKFVADGRYDPTVMDPQIGAMAVLKTLMEIDPEARFPEAGPEQPPETEAPTQAPAEIPLSPRADDPESEVKPRLRKSRTIWGGLVSYTTTMGSAVVGFFERLDNPYMLAAFLAVVLVASLALYLVISGRINVGKIVAHLSEDDTDA